MGSREAGSFHTAPTIRPLFLMGVVQQTAELPLRSLVEVAKIGIYTD